MLINYSLISKKTRLRISKKTRLRIFRTWKVPSPASLAKERLLTPSATIWISFNRSSSSIWSLASGIL